MTRTTSATKKIFIAYAHKDLAFVKRLENYLQTPETKIYMHEIEDKNPNGENLSQADIVLLMVSPDFLNSDYCYSSEIAQVIEQQEQKTVRVFPVLLRPIYWEKTPFAHLQALPFDIQPITLHDAPSRALQVVAQTIQATANNGMNETLQTMIPSLSDLTKTETSRLLTTRRTQQIARRHLPLFGYGRSFLIACAMVFLVIGLGILLNKNLIFTDHPVPARASRPLPTTRPPISQLHGSYLGTFVNATNQLAMTMSSLTEAANGRFTANGNLQGCPVLYNGVVRLGVSISFTATGTAGTPCAGVAVFTGQLYPDGHLAGTWQSFKINDWGIWWQSTTNGGSGIWTLH